MGHIILCCMLLLGMSASCKMPEQLKVTIHSIFPMGRLIAGKVCKLKVICNTESSEGPITHVAADLSQLGGIAKQGLEHKPDGTWRWEGEVLQGAKGAQTLTVTATDSANNENKKDM
jgi:hypothetical protein